MTDQQIVYATVRCCRDWPIVYSLNGMFWGWRRCGLCMERPTLIAIDGNDVTPQ